MNNRISEELRDEFARLEQLDTKTLERHAKMAALRKLGTQVFSVLLSLEPAVAAILGILLLMEMPNEIQTLGLAWVVIASIAIVRLRSDPA